MEIWKDVKGFEGKYEVSSLGNVRSINRIEDFMGSVRLRRGKDMKTRYVNKYLTVGLKDYTIHKSAFVHRLVAEAFIGDVTGKVVDHIDFNPENNRVENLQILTQQENIDRSVNAKRHNYGERHGMSKLKIDSVIKIREAEKGTIAGLCRELGIAYQTAKRIRSGKIWKLNI